MTAGPMITGRTWSFEADINTDLIMPPAAIFAPPHEATAYCMQANRPGWAEQVRPGDIIVAARNFGTGSSRPAPRVLRDLGIACVLADSVNGLFFRNAVNYALPTLEVDGISSAFAEGDVAEIDFDNARIRNTRTGAQLQGVAWPPELRAILDAGGLIAQLVTDGLVAPPDSAGRT
jgi:3-isopropylmalate/(R)-2-methylmalate dehydratase small subunit